MKNKQNILLTGSEGLIGSNFIKNCHSEYKNIFALDIKKKIKKNYFRCDITSEMEVKNTINNIIKKDNIDVLINNASNNPAANKKMQSYKFTDYKLSDWNKNLSTDLIGSFLMSKYILKHFEKQKQGTIINISSIYGLTGIDQSIYSKKLKKFHGYKPLEYSVAKAGIIGLTKSLASYYKNSNIKILCLILGGIEMNQSNFFKKNYKNKTIINRMALLNEYNEYLKFFSSQKASYSTGTCVVIDGGATNIF
ncbi:SDR family oxidoreductase [Candidatus Pelagibacter sp.]|nr:SDR family oxidoreductase [Candidatus Pelagibacter sp.]